MTIRGGGNPIVDMACAPRFRMGPPPRSFAADAYDCIMVWIRIGSTEYKCVARGSAPDGEFPSDPAPLAVHPPYACSGVKALPNTSSAKAARRAPLTFRSLTPSARSGKLTTGDGTKNGLPRSEQRTGAIDLKKL